MRPLQPTRQKGTTASINSDVQVLLGHLIQSCDCGQTDSYRRTSPDTLLDHPARRAGDGPFQDGDMTKNAPQDDAPSPYAEAYYELAYYELGYLEQKLRRNQLPPPDRDLVDWWVWLTFQLSFARDVLKSDECKRLLPAEYEEMCAHAWCYLHMGLNAAIEVFNLNREEIGDHRGMHPDDFNKSLIVILEAFQRGTMSQKTLDQIDELLLDLELMKHAMARYELERA